MQGYGNVFGQGSLNDRLSVDDLMRECGLDDEEVSEATDDQASTEEVASMIDQFVDQTERVSAEVEQVAATNEAQTTQIRGIDETVQRLGDADGDGEGEPKPPDSVGLGSVEPLNR